MVVGDSGGIAKEQVEFAGVVGEVGESGCEAPDGVGFGAFCQGALEGLAFEIQQAAFAPDGGDDLFDAVLFGGSVGTEFGGEGGEEGVEIAARFGWQDGGVGTESVAQGVHGGTPLAFFGLASFCEFG